VRVDAVKKQSVSSLHSPFRYLSTASNPPNKPSSFVRSSERFFESERKESQFEKKAEEKEENLDEKKGEDRREREERERER